VSVRVTIAARALFCPQLGGHLWAYLNWALGLREVGCEVVWLETVNSTVSKEVAGAHLRALSSSLEQWHMEDCVAVCAAGGDSLPEDWTPGCAAAPDAVTESDLLLDLSYDVPAALLKGCKRSALVDIDPGALQIWMSTGQLMIPPHDIYFTIGETVAKGSALCPDCGVDWQHTPPPVCLAEWPVSVASESDPYTTVSQWSTGEWIVDGEQVFKNDKRTSFVDYIDLPSLTTAHLELALTLGDDEQSERRLLEDRGWRVRRAADVSSTAEDYRRYVQSSRGEFSCAKPAYTTLQSGWVSDRTLCYLASGKPAIVQHTGTSDLLPDAEGLFRFRTRADAVAALETAESDYTNHCGAARALAEHQFDARKVVASVLERALA
jgi:hypothetical protein